MFDLNDETISRVEKGTTPIDRIPVDDSSVTTPAEDPLDSGLMRELHARLVGFYRTELSRQEENRSQMATDEDYYDSIQFTEEQMNTLRERGQPSTVYNVIQQTVNWVCGSEKRSRTDFKILPRNKQDAKPAEGKSKYMKYLSDVNKTVFHRSKAFEDAVKCGVGWLEEATQDEDDGETIYCQYESWRHIVFDSADTSLDGSGMRYCFRSKFVDEDIAIAVFPHRKAQIQAASSDASILYGASDMQDGDLAMDLSEAERESAGALAGGDVTNTRRRVRLIEAWYRTPETVKKIRGAKSPYNGQIFDENDQRHIEELQNGSIAVVDKVMMRVRVAIMTTGDMLYEGASPYRHNRFKFIPVWGYRRGRDGLPYGIIRSVRDIQDDVNKRMAKALHIISTNKVIMDEGALAEGWTMEKFAEEVSRPDAILVKKQGKDMSINVDHNLEPAHLEFASRNIQMIQQVGGVTDELLGRTTNAISGIAVQKRQEQGSLATAKFFDNLRLAEQLRGEIELSLVEQFVTEEQEFRVTNQRGSPEYIKVNDGLPENDITRTKADFVISEEDWRSTMRQAAVEQLTEMLSRMPPEVGIAMLDLVVDSMDIPNREEIVKRIRAINMQRDPDAEEPTPEEMAQAQAAQMQQKIQMEQIAADLREKNARAGKAEAETDKIKAETVGARIQAEGGAFEAAAAVVQLPAIAGVADNILAEAGWHDAKPVRSLPHMPQPQQEQPQPPQEPQQQEQMPPEQQGGMPQQGMPPEQAPIGEGAEPQVPA